MHKFTFVRSRFARICSWICLGVITLWALFPQLAPYDPLAVHPADALQPPSWQHLFGTDDSGRDVFSRVIAGTRASVLIGVCATICGLLLGTVLGIIAGGSTSRALAPVRYFADRLIETLFAFPGLLLLLLLVAVRGNDPATLIAALALGVAPGFARLLRGEVRRLLGAGFVEAARVCGEKPAALWLRYILPQAFKPVLPLAGLGVAHAVIAAAGLGFLGLGAPPPSPEWGALINAGRPYLMQAWWLTFFPGLVITALGVALALLAADSKHAAGAMRTAKPRICTVSCGTDKGADATPENTPAATPAATPGSTPDLAQPAQRVLVQLTDYTLTLPGQHEAVLHKINLRLAAGECVALVGASGSGKSLTAASLLGLAPPGAHTTGDILLSPTFTAANTHADTLMPAPAQRSAAWRRIRGKHIALVPQNALGALNPLRRVGREVADVLRIHSRSKTTAKHTPVATLITDTLRTVGLQNPARIARQRGFELSGGMRQRALIAGAVIADPQLIIADEPTTALDAENRAAVLQLLKQRTEAGAGVLIISHDLASVRDIADRVYVLQAGRVVENGSCATLFANPQAAYTRLLVGAQPQLAVQSALAESGANAATAHARSDTDAYTRPGTSPGMISSTDAHPHTNTDASMGMNVGTRTRQPLLHINNLTVYVGAGANTRTLLQNLNLHVLPGDAVGIVGASGSGKTTLLRIILGLHKQFSGTVQLTAPIAWVPQDPLDSFTPGITGKQLLSRALHLSGTAKSQIPDEIAALCRQVELDVSLLQQNVSQLSGGELQRLAIARALALRAQLLLLDEPLSALDAVVQAEILKLLVRLRYFYGTALLLVSHDAEVVAALCDKTLTL